MISSLKNNASLRKGSRYFKNLIFRKTSFNKNLKKCSVRKHKNQDKLPLFLDGFRLNVKSVIKIAVVISMAVIATLYLASVLLF